MVDGQARAARVGIFGGTFDPIHIGHLIIAEEARAVVGLDQVIFVPARVSPLKIGGALFSAEDRLRMVELATADNPAFKVSSIDIARTGPSFTVDTLRLFRERLGAAAQLYFIMGMDSLQHLGLWRAPEEIIGLARIVAIKRPGTTIDWARLERQLPGLREVTTELNSLEIGISSTSIRERLDAGLPIRYQVPRIVEDYILARSEKDGVVPSREAMCY